MDLCFELEGELDPITLYTNREISRNMSYGAMYKAPT
jgi:hypothetical protein